MKFSINTYFDDQDGSFVAENYFINGEQVSEEEYDAVIEEFDGIDEFENVEDEIEICNCPDCESTNYLQVVTDAVNDVLEMFEDENTCDCCKFNALMSLVMLGADGVLQGCIGIDGDEEGISQLN